MGDTPRTPWLIRLALAAFPRAFRDAHAAEMEEDYAEAWSACETRAARAWLVVPTVLDMVASGLRERRRVARSNSPARADDGARQSARFRTMDFADAVMETARSFNEGEVWAKAARSPRNTIRTTLEQFAAEVFAPAYKAVAHSTAQAARPQGSCDR